jgi:hypothetical protein
LKGYIVRQRYARQRQAIVVIQMHCRRWIDQKK